MSKPIILQVECIVCNELLQKIKHNPEEVSRKMGKIAHRRSRTPNWSVGEKQYLLELIRQRQTVITRTTNGPNYYEEKDVAWNEILRAMAARFGNKFTVSSIKKVKTQWQNMKRIAREEINVYGVEVNKYTRQSLEVCKIIGVVKNGVLVRNENGEVNPNLNETINPAAPIAPAVIAVPRPNIEIKTERIDEDPLQPSCSTTNFMDTVQPSCSNTNFMDSTNTTDTTIQIQPQKSVQFESSSSVSETETQEDEAQDQEAQQDFECLPEEERQKDAAANTETSFLEDLKHLNSVRKNFQEFMRFSSAEKQLKLDNLKEERYAVRAMRETAELHKIIAEQRLKHVLWIKRKEMEMYGAGEPGSGAGKGGGTGGAIRDAGGSFGKMEAAREDQYFYNQQKEQIAKLKSHMDKEIAFHEEQIKRHEDAIRRHKQQQSELEKK